MLYAQRCLLLSSPFKHVLVWWHRCKPEFCKPGGSRGKRKHSTCPLGASDVPLLMWTLVLGRKRKESLLDSDCPKVNTNQVKPKGRNKTAHIHLV